MAFVDVLWFCWNLTTAQKPQITNLACDFDQCKSTTHLKMPLSDNIKTWIWLALRDHTHYMQPKEAYSHANIQSGLGFQTKRHIQLTWSVLQLNDHNVGPNVQYLHHYLFHFPCSQSSNCPTVIWLYNPTAAMCFSISKKNLISNFMVIFLLFLNPGTFCCFQDGWNKAAPTNPLYVCCWYTNFPGASSDKGEHIVAKFAFNYCS